MHFSSLGPWCQHLQLILQSTENLLLWDTYSKAWMCFGLYAVNVSECVGGNLPNVELWRTNVLVLFKQLEKQERMWVCGISCQFSGPIVQTRWVQISLFSVTLFITQHYSNLKSRPKSWLNKLGLNCISALVHFYGFQEILFFFVMRISLCRQIITVTPEISDPTVMKAAYYFYYIWRDVPGSAFIQMFYFFHLECFRRFWSCICGHPISNFVGFPFPWVCLILCWYANYNCDYVILTVQSTEWILGKNVNAAFHSQCLWVALQKYW